MRISKIIPILVILGFLLPSFSFAPTPNLVWGFAQKEIITPPETLEEAKEIGERTIKGTIESFPKILERVWREEVLPIWRGMYNWAKKNFWDPYIWPSLKKIESIFKKEMGERKPIIKEEFKKEKEELKEEAPKIGKSLWERFKELIK